MKKYSIVFTLIACIATLGIMTSCSKDNSELIVGNWEVTSVTLNGMEMTDNVPVGATFTFTIDGIVTISYMGHSESNRYIMADENYVVMGEVTYKIEELTKKTLKLLDVDEEAVHGGIINFVRV